MLLRFLRMVLPVRCLSQIVRPALSSPGRLRLIRHHLERHNPLGYRRVRTEQFRGETLLRIHYSPQRVGDCETTCLANFSHSVWDFLRTGNFRDSVSEMFFSFLSELITDALQILPNDIFQFAALNRSFSRFNRPPSSPRHISVTRPFSPDTPSPQAP